MTRHVVRLPPLLAIVLGALACSPASDARGTAGDASKAATAIPDSTRPLPDGLTGSEWQLVEIQSMDDAVGATRPEEPARFTMRLGADGTASLMLDCNRATGPWTAEAAGDGTSGRFGLGPLAATGALCPPPRLDEQITGQAQYVRGYRLQDGRLHLTLMADGGIWTWEPADGVPFQTLPDSALEDAIRAAEPAYTRAIVDVGGGTGQARYVYGRVDLNGDGRSEVLVYLLGSVFCGTGGCNMLLFTASPDGYQLLKSFTTSRLPVVVLGRVSKGWSDIAFLRSGGGVPGAYVRFGFDGKRYRQLGTLPGDRVPAGRPQLVGDLTFDKGIPLRPSGGDQP